MVNEESGSNAVATVALVAIVVLAVGAAIWFYAQPRTSGNEQPGTDTSINVTLPGGEGEQETSN